MQRRDCGQVLQNMTHRPGAIDVEIKDKRKVSWGSVTSLENWLTSQPTDKWKQEWEENGVLVVENLVDGKELDIYKDVYQQILDGKIDTSSHRHDLGNHEERRQNTENICQVMWPSIFVEGLKEGPMHTRARAVAKVIMGDDAELDFDMLLSKCAMDDVDVDNGCMWFSPGAHKKELWPHRPVTPGVHVLMCEATEEVGKPYPLSAGSCTFHHGKMLHYSRGNTTDRPRRAYVTNFRPKDMIEYERRNDYDHGKSAGVKEIIETGKAHDNKS